MSDSKVTKDSLILVVLVITLIMSTGTLYLVSTSLSGSSETSEKIDTQSENILALSKSMESLSESTSDMAEILGAIPPEFFEPTVVVDLPPIRIGYITTLTGYNAFYGGRLYAAVQIAVERANEDGGILLAEGRRRVEVIFEDSKAITAEAVAAAKKLIEKDKVCVLIGAWMSGNTMAIIPIAEENEIPLVMDDGTNWKFSAPPELGGVSNEWAFHNYIVDAMAARVASDKVVEIHNVTKVAFMAVNTDWGTGSIASWKPEYERLGVEVVYEATFDRAEMEFYSHLLKIQETGADLITLTTYGEGIPTFVRQWKELGGVPPIFSIGTVNQAVIELAGEDVLGIWDQGQYNPEYQTPENQYLTKEILARYGHVADKGNAMGWNAINVAIEAIKRAGTTDPSAIRDALEETSYLGCMGLIEYDEENHQCTPLLWLKQARLIDGQILEVRDHTMQTVLIDWDAEK